MKCMYLSNTTLFRGREYIYVYICIYIYIYIYNLLHKDQLHISALDNGHLQVEIEKLSKQLYLCWLYTVRR